MYHFFFSPRLCWQFPLWGGEQTQSQVHISPKHLSECLHRHILYPSTALGARVGTWKYNNPFKSSCLSPKFETSKLDVLDSAGSVYRPDHRRCLGLEYRHWSGIKQNLPPVADKKQNYWKENVITIWFTFTQSVRSEIRHVTFGIIFTRAAADWHFDNSLTCFV